MSHLRLAEGSNSALGLIVTNAPGAWSNGSTDPMYDSYIYPFDGGDVTVTVTNLPTGQYDVYLYANDGNFEVKSGGADYGVQSSHEDPVTNPPVWQAGVQYALFTNVTVASAGQPVVITVYPGEGGYAIISGMQIVQSTPSRSLGGPFLLP